MCCEDEGTERRSASSERGSPIDGVSRGQVFGLMRWKEVVLLADSSCLRFRLETLPSDGRSLFSSSTTGTIILAD